MVNEIDVTKNVNRHEEGFFQFSRKRHSLNLALIIIMFTYEDGNFRLELSPSENSFWE